MPRCIVCKKSFILGDEFFKHFEEVHDIIVRRSGESKDEAEARVKVFNPFCSHERMLWFWEIQYALDGSCDEYHKKKKKKKKSKKETETDEDESPAVEGDCCKEKFHRLLGVKQ